MYTVNDSCERCTVTTFLNPHNVKGERKIQWLCASCHKFLKEENKILK